jgi:hypothetical protein
MGDANSEGGRRRSLKVKTLRRMLKKKGKKTTGKKATLMKRLHMRGGAATCVDKDGDTVMMPPEVTEWTTETCKPPNVFKTGVVVQGGRRSRRRHRREEGGRRSRRRHSRPMGVIF